ncbi:MAG: cobyrinic acid a,c-diamide synthase, partial [Alphaproteobacteria bacterium]|nr:cobyrinic acid a,c-diamide synthase [Alphaproteobacteria bacterium]
KRKLHLGYRQARLVADHCLGKTNGLLRGHEFHYATITKEEGAPFAFVRDAYETEEKPAGLRAGHVSGSFFHVIA